MRMLNTLLVFFLLFLPLLVAAQPPPPGDPGGDPDVPITGIEFLMGGGALLGVRHLIGRLKSSRKE